MVKMMFGQYRMRDEKDETTASMIIPTEIIPNVFVKGLVSSLNLATAVDRFSK
jgi:hypothetical protein